MENNGKTQEELLGFWKVYVSMQFPKAWPVLERLNLLKGLSEENVPISQCLQKLQVSHSDESLQKICNKMLSYDEQLLDSVGFREKFMEFQQMELRRIYRSNEERLMNRRKQEIFVSNEETKEIAYLQLHLTGDLSRTMMEPLVLGLRTLADQVKILHYLDVHKISFNEYGHQQLNYTCLDKDLAEQLEAHTRLKFIEEITKHGLEEVSTDEWIPFSDLTFSAPAVVLETVVELLNIVQGKMGQIKRMEQVWNQLSPLFDAFNKADLSGSQRSEMRQEIFNALEALLLLMEAGVLQEYRLVEIPKVKKASFWTQLLNRLKYRSTLL